MPVYADDGVLQMMVRDRGGRCPLCESALEDCRWLPGVKHAYCPQCEEARIRIALEAAKMDETNTRDLLNKARARERQARKDLQLVEAKYARSKKKRAQATAKQWRTKKEQLRAAVSACNEAVGAFVRLMKKVDTLEQGLLLVLEPSAQM